METKNDSKKVEKKISLSVYDITVDVEQNVARCCSRNLLTIDYRVASTCKSSLSEFILKLKSNPIERFSDNFFCDVSINTIITIDKVDPSEYTIGEVPDSGALYILSCHENYRSNNLFKCDCDLIGYHSNLK